MHQSKEKNLIKYANSTCNSTNELKRSTDIICKKATTNSEPKNGLGGIEYNASQLDILLSTSKPSQEQRKVIKKYNRTIKPTAKQETPILYGLDFLKMNFKSKKQEIDYSEIVKVGFTVEKLEYKNQFFSIVEKIFYKGVEFCEVVRSPYEGSILDKSFLQIKVSNHWLYQSPTDLRNVMDAFIISTQIKFESFNRVDLYIDFHDLKGLGGNDIALAYDKYKILIKGKNEVDLKGVNKHHETIQGLTIGQRHVGYDRFTRMYNKTLEMQTKTLKPYIIEKHNQTWGEQPENSIYRLEFELKNEYLKRVNETEKNKDWHYYLWDFRQVVAIESNIIDLFTWVYNDRYSEKNKNEELKLYDVGTLEHKGLAIQFKLKQRQTNKQKAIAVRNQLKGNLRQWMNTDNDIFLITYKLIQETTGYFISTERQKQWEEDIKKELTEKIEYQPDYITQFEAEI